MPNEGFFDNSDEMAAAKCALIETYYMAWLQNTRNTYGDYITFIDLFTGPGRYGNGKPSAPLMVLTEAVEDAKLREMMVAVLNDKDHIDIRALEESIKSIPNIDKLTNKPRFLCVETDAEFLTSLKYVPMNPCISFVDLWGTSGLTTELLKFLLAGVWGCDCFFFFDYSRVASGLSSTFVSRYLRAIFGEQRALEVSDAASRLKPADRELFLANALGERLEAEGGKYVIPFRYCGKSGEPTSQYIYFVSKHYDGYDILKEIISIDRNASGRYMRRFDYTFTDDPSLSLLHGFTPSQEKLSEQIMREFAGQFESVRTIYSKHNRRTLYTKKDYQDALLELELAGLIQCSPAERRQHTMSDNVMVSFSS